MPPGEKSDDMEISENLQWDVDMEVQLFYAMAGHKPVGINKHFHMACIWEKLSNSITKEITTRDIWDHLETLYDIPLLDETESVPFPNEDVDFSLPESDFTSLIKQKCRDAILADDVDDEVPSPKIQTTPKPVARSVTSRENTPKATASKRDQEKSSSSSTKSRKESGGSLPPNDGTPLKIEKDSSSKWERRRDSRDSNASSTREGSGGRSGKSKERSAKTRTSSTTGSDKGADESMSREEESSARRAGRRRGQPTPPAGPGRRRRI